MRFFDWVYNGLIHGALPIVVPQTYLSFNGRNPNYHTAKKFDVPSSDVIDPPTTLWIHCASVGESTLVNQLLEWNEEYEVPRERIFVTTQTLSGLRNVKHRRKILLPFDYPGLIAPLVHGVQANCLIVIETEIWPNLFRLHPNKLALLNGRVSDETFGMYKMITPIMRTALNHVDTILARSEHDQERLGSLGPESTSVNLGGNLKWARCLDPAADDASFEFESDRPLVVVGSTHEGEETMILEAMKDRNVNLILAPRHLDRLNSVESDVKESGWDWLRFSEIDSESSISENLVLLDEFGRLEGCYRKADLAVVGGSWDSTGGHNLLEAAQYGVPVVTGPNLSNFRDSAELLQNIGLLDVVNSVDELRSFLDRWEESRDQENPGDWETRLRENLKPIKDTYVSAIRDLLD